MAKVSIGVPTYNDNQRIRDLFTTLVMYTDFPEDQYKLVMLDDGTQDKTKVEGLRELSEEFGIPLIENQKNEGIPYSWNRLTEYHEAEYVIIFNDDIQFKDSKWLRNFVYFMDNNQHAGAAGFPLVHIDPVTGNRNMNIDLPDENVNPGRVGSPVGCAFGFRQALWKQIKQPDGSTGFWEALVSFHEELDFGFEIAKLGFGCYMLPTPSVEHWGSMTFSKNAELSVRKIIEYLPREEYLDIMRRGIERLALPYKEHARAANEQDLAYRMDYSRVMFAKKWNSEDKWRYPQEQVHRQYVDTLPKVNVKWIDRENEECEVLM
jgi:GT2 family glycosyltransferase